MKKLLTIIAVLIIIGLVAFAYITRTPSAPSQEVGELTNILIATSSEALYRISTSSSKVTFRIDEVLRNEPFTAVGTTSEIAGDIKISSSTITIGTIAINARTFKTDDERRDGAISRAILKAEDPANEFIYFKPTGPIQIPAGSTSTINFPVTGDLTVAGITKPATFNVTADISTTTLTGQATLTMKRADYNLVIPNVPFVASVDDEFTVVTDIVAPRVE